MKEIFHQIYSMRYHLLLLLLLCSCASGGNKIDLGEAQVSSAPVCGTDSYLNQYAVYNCASLELESSNDYVNSSSPIHNIKDVVSIRKQNLLVVEEKIFGASLRESDQEVVCQRRLQVVLNPGVGHSKLYQKGWVTYRPSCFQFYQIKPTKLRAQSNRSLTKYTN